MASARRIASVAAARAIIRTGRERCIGLRGRLGRICRCGLPIARCCMPWCAVTTTAAYPDAPVPADEYGCKVRSVERASARAGDWLRGTREKKGAEPIVAGAMRQPTNLLREAGFIHDR